MRRARADRRCRARRAGRESATRRPRSERAPRRSSPRRVRRRCRATCRRAPRDALPRRRRRRSTRYARSRRRDSNTSWRSGARCPRPDAPAVDCTRRLRSRARRRVETAQGASSPHRSPCPTRRSESRSNHRRCSGLARPPRPRGAPRTRRHGADRASEVHRPQVRFADRRRAHHRDGRAAGASSASPRGACARARLHPPRSRAARALGAVAAKQPVQDLVGAWRS